MQFTEEIIKGKMPTKMLPDRYSLILEGGGMRGFYSAGVLDAFMDEGIMFPYIIAVSAGAANVLSYVSGQKGRNRVVAEKYVGSHRYFGMRNLLFKKSLFDFDYIFSCVGKEHVFFDKEVFDNVDVRLLTGAANCDTGETLWYEKDDLGADYIPTIASCSIPMVSKIVHYNGVKLLDGGITSPIPIEKSIADGNKFHIIILTRNKGYYKKPFKYKKIANRFYRKHPLFVEAILKRHEVYNRQVDICEQLEQEGKAIIIRPQSNLEVGRATKNTKKIVKLYDEGYEEGKLAVKKLLEKMEVTNGIRKIRKK